MTATATPTAPCYRWYPWRPEARSLDCGTAMLVLGAGRTLRHYWVKRLWDRGEVVGWRLTRFDVDDETGRELAVYDIPADFSSCDCPDFYAKAHTRPDGCCKHIRAARAALAEAGF